MYIRTLWEMKSQTNKISIPIFNYSSPMASFGNSSFSYLFLVMLFSSSLIQARESKFFSKITHFSTTNFEPTKPSLLSPIEAPAPTPFVAQLAPTLAPAPTSENGRSDLFTPAKEENEIFNEEFDGETYQYNNYNDKSSYNGNYNNNNGNGYKLASESHETANPNNYNGYNVASESHETANQNNYNGFAGNYKYNNNGYELASDNGYETGNRNDNYYNKNGYESNQQLGMSDTRYMAGGKYSYNAKNENYYNPANEYQIGKEINTQNQAYYGNFENQNEFNNLQYENQQLYDEQGSQEEESLP